MSSTIDYPPWPGNVGAYQEHLQVADTAFNSTPGFTTDDFKITYGKTRTSQDDIAEVCDEIKALLLEKNRKYGDSALNPRRTFAKSDALEQIRVRMDDKLNRIQNAQDDEDEDVIQDLMGYLVLYRVAIKQQERRASAGA